MSALDSLGEGTRKAQMAHSLAHSGKAPGSAVGAALEHRSQPPSVAGSSGAARNGRPTRRARPILWRDQPTSRGRPVCSSRHGLRSARPPAEGSRVSAAATSLELVAWALGPEMRRTWQSSSCVCCLQ